jgi:GMP synthase (glutamine-hydrolysing)
MKFSLKEFLKIAKFGWVMPSIKALPTNGVKLASTHDVNLLLTKLKRNLCNSIPSWGFSFYRWIKMLENFLVKIAEPQLYTKCFCWRNGTERKKNCRDDKVVLGLSGGVSLLWQQFYCTKLLEKIYMYFVNNGLLRKTDSKTY